MQTAVSHQVARILAIFLLVLQHIKPLDGPGEWVTGIAPKVLGSSRGPTSVSPVDLLP